MAGEGEFRSYLDHVRLTIENATEEALRQAAFQIVAHAQVNVQTNAQIDTGFMLNAIYAVTRQDSGYAAAKSQAEQHLTSRKTGQPVDKSGSMAPERSPEEGGEDVLAIVVAGANYSIYQEQQNSFLYRAAEQAAGEVGGTAEAIYQDQVRD